MAPRSVPLLLVQAGAHLGHEPRTAVLCLSANGLGVQTAGTWRVLAKGEEVVASVGDRIVFAAGVEGLLSKRSG